MPTESILHQDAPGLTVYFALTNTAGEFFDFDDDTWKVLASVTTVALAATERPISADRSLYVATLDLDAIAPGLAPVAVVANAYRQSGGSADPEVDDILSQPEPLTVRLGQVGLVDADFEVHNGLWDNSTSGTELALIVCLKCRGEIVPLHTIDDGAECTVDITLHGNDPQVSLDAEDMGAVNAAHRFEPTYENPNFTADRIYVCKTTITADGVSFVREKTFGVAP
jgi:hypothetical protein